jgi:hypothetical protein
MRGKITLSTVSKLRQITTSFLVLLAGAGNQRASLRNQTTALI